MIEIFIPENTPSSKNSRIWTGRFSVASKSTKKWRIDTQEYWEKFAKEFREEFDKKPKPTLVGFHFIRKSKHRWDFCNICQAPLDEMVKYGWIEDDNSSIILPVPLKIENKYWDYNKNNPGFIIKILD